MFCIRFAKPLRSISKEITKKPTGWFPCSFGAGAAVSHGGCVQWHSPVDYQTQTSFLRILKPSCLTALTWCSNCPGTMLDIGPAAKKTMTRHAPIKLLLKSLLLAYFHSVSFRLVSGRDLQVSGCDIRDSVLSTPNRLYKDARQKKSDAARAFISLGMKGSGESKGARRPGDGWGGSGRV